MKRVSLDALARVANVLDGMADGKIVVRAQDGTQFILDVPVAGWWTIGTETRGGFLREELVAIVRELLERRALDTRRALAIAEEAAEGSDLSIPEPETIDVDDVKRRVSELLESARGPNER